MSRNVFPIPPAGTPILEEGGKQFAPVWMRYLKALGDEWVTANRVSRQQEADPTDIDPRTGKPRLKDTGLQFVANGNALFCVFQRPTGSAKTTFSLPFPAALQFDALGAVQPSGASSVTIPVGTDFAQWWYIATFPAA